MASECVEALLEKGKVIIKHLIVCQIFSQTGPNMHRFLLPLPMEESQPQWYKNQVELPLMVEAIHNKIPMPQTLFQNATSAMRKVTSLMLVKNEVM